MISRRSFFKSLLSTAAAVSLGAALELGMVVEKIVRPPQVWHGFYVVVDMRMPRWDWNEGKGWIQRNEPPTWEHLKI